MRIFYFYSQLKNIDISVIDWQTMGLKGMKAWFQVTLMQRWQYPIHSGTLKTLSDSVLFTYKCV